MQKSWYPFIQATWRAVFPFLFFKFKEILSSKICWAHSMSPEEMAQCKIESFSISWWFRLAFPSSSSNQNTSWNPLTEERKRGEWWFMLTSSIFPFKCLYSYMSNQTMCLLLLKTAQWRGLSYSGFVHICLHKDSSFLWSKKDKISSLPFAHT